MAVDLTTLALIKTRLFSGTSDVDPGSDYDTLIGELINDVSDHIGQRCDRVFGEATHTEYPDGSGTDTLLLSQGPLVSVTSVNTVEYGDDGVGARTETLTAVDEADRLEVGLRAENAIGLAGIRLRSGIFTKGRRNYKVIYVGGFLSVLDGTAGDIPLALRDAATAHVSALFNLRGLEGIATKDVGDGSRSTIPTVSLDAALDRAIAPFRVLGAH